jgi:predicted RNA-binding protein Jag
MKLTVEELAKRLDVLQEAQVVVNYRLFEALLSCDAKAAQLALAHLARHTTEPDQADEQAKAVSAQLAQQVRLFQQAVALRASAAAVHEVVTRAKTGSGPA